MLIEVAEIYNNFIARLKGINRSTMTDRDLK